MVTKGQPQGGINLPSSSELGGLTLSQACLASSSGRKRLGGGPSADEAPKERGGAEGEIRTEAEMRKAGESRGKWAGSPEARGAGTGARVLRGPGLTLWTDPLLRPPCWGVGAAGARTQLSGT